MSTLTLNESLLSDLRRRRAAGERVSQLAGEIGVAWQRLDKALRRGLHSEPAPRLHARAGHGALTEKYRPERLDAIFGQPGAVRFLRRFVQAPCPMAMVFEGETGAGKTSAAQALAAELGCCVSEGELGGLFVIASGEQTADAVREVCGRMWQTPMFGSGWKVIVVNEADRMNPAAETVWLDRLEGIPPRTVVVFTTNHLGKLSQRFRDRCTRVSFESDAAALRESVEAMLAAMWKCETGRRPSKRVLRELADRAVEDGKLSFRRAAQLLQACLMERD
jgi:DNA polymerase III delta prime subunit